MGRRWRRKEQLWKNTLADVLRRCHEHFRGQVEEDNFVPMMHLLTKLPGWTEEDVRHVVHISYIKDCTARFETRGNSVRATYKVISASAAAEEARKVSEGVDAPASIEGHEQQAQSDQEVSSHQRFVASAPSRAEPEVPLQLPAQHPQDTWAAVEEAREVRRTAPQAPPPRLLRPEDAEATREVRHTVAKAPPPPLVRPEDFRTTADRRTVAKAPPPPLVRPEDAEETREVPPSLVRPDDSPEEDREVRRTVAKAPPPPLVRPEDFRTQSTPTISRAPRCFSGGR
eukprot:TRINITY_DN4925_c0_g1_i5.p2 TRINITY_DN4925_c0_g1~~TRINITY_DN4925_c0_g1_i5.p2  ORF type:complete len:285 (-),score=39.73 TRINITY_DN4925_c0_g1_i5:720-1574(-)